MRRSFTIPGISLLLVAGITSVSFTAAGAGPAAHPWDRYRWLNQAQEFCLSVSTAAGMPSVIHAFGAVPSTRRRANFAEAMAAVSGIGNDGIQVGRVGRAWVTVEPNGWTCNRPAVAAQLSRSGRFVSFYMSVEADMGVLVGRNGMVIRNFDPLLSTRKGALPQESGLPFGRPAGAVPASFALIERLTGVRISQRWLLADRHWTYRRRG